MACISHVHLLQQWDSCCGKQGCKIDCVKELEWWFLHSSSNCFISMSTCFFFHSVTNGKCMLGNSGARLCSFLQVISSAITIFSMLWIMSLLPLNSMWTWCPHFINTSWRRSAYPTLSNESPKISFQALVQAFWIIASMKQYLYPYGFITTWSTWLDTMGVLAMVDAMSGTTQDAL